MTKKDVQIRPADCEPGDIGDALDREIDLLWALIAGLQTIHSEHPDPYTHGTLVLANAILDRLNEIRRDVDRL
jgi:hypothetical protein